MHPLTTIRFGAERTWVQFSIKLVTDWPYYGRCERKVGFFGKPKRLMPILCEGGNELGYTKTNGCTAAGRGDRYSARM